MIFSSDMRASCSSVSADAVRQEDKSCVKDGGRDKEEMVGEDRKRCRQRDGRKRRDTLREETGLSLCLWPHVFTKITAALLQHPVLDHRNT